MPLPVLPPIDTEDYAAYVKTRLRRESSRALLERAQAIPPPAYRPPPAPTTVTTVPTTVTPPAAAPTTVSTTVSRPSGGPIAEDLVPSQLAGGQSLSTAEAMSACGPAAAVAFARQTGRNPTLREAVDIAKSVGWSEAQGMAGPASQQKLLEKMGVSAKLESGVNWAKVRADVEGGNPVTISTPKHYFVATGYDEATDRFNFQASGEVLKGGARWLKPADVQRLGNGLQGALYLDNPEPGTAPSVVAPVRTLEQPAPATGPVDLSSREAFAQSAGPYAKAIEAETGIPAEIMMGIAINEGALAKGTVASQYNNLFGIKATRDWQGATTPTMGAWEVVGGKNVTQPSTFRAYESPAESFRDFATFLRENPRYGTALQHTADPNRFIQELKTAGYATDPAWTQKVLSIAKGLPDLGPAPPGGAPVSAEAPMAPAAVAPPRTYGSPQEQLADIMGRYGQGAPTQDFAAGAEAQLNDLSARYGLPQMAPRAPTRPGAPAPNYLDIANQELARTQAARAASAWTAAVPPPVVEPEAPEPVYVPEPLAPEPAPMLTGDADRGIGLGLPPSAPTGDVDMGIGLGPPPGQEPLPWAEQRQAAFPEPPLPQPLPPPVEPTAPIPEPQPLPPPEPVEPTWAEQRQEAFAPPAPLPPVAGPVAPEWAAQREEAFTVPPPPPPVPQPEPNPFERVGRALVDALKGVPELTPAPSLEPMAPIPPPVPAVEQAPLYPETTISAAPQPSYPGPLAAGLGAAASALGRFGRTIVPDVEQRIIESGGDPYAPENREAVEYAQRQANLGTATILGPLSVAGGPTGAAIGAASELGALAAPGVVRGFGGTEEQAQIGGGIAGVVPAAPALVGAGVAAGRAVPGIARGVAGAARTLQGALRMPSWEEAVASLAGRMPGVTTQGLMNDPEAMANITRVAPIHDGPELERALAGISDPDAKFLTIVHRSPIDDLAVIHPREAGTRTTGPPSEGLFAGQTSWDVLNSPNRSLEPGFGDNFYLGQIPRRGLIEVASAADIPADVTPLLDGPEHIIGAYVKDTGTLRLWIPKAVIKSEPTDFAPQTLADLQQAVAPQVGRMGSVAMADLPFRETAKPRIGGVAQPVVARGQYSELGDAKRIQLAELIRAKGENNPVTVEELRALAQPRGAGQNPFDRFKGAPVPIEELMGRLETVEGLDPNTKNWYPPFGRWFGDITGGNEPLRQLVAGFFGLSAWSSGPFDNTRATGGALRTIARLNREGKLTHAAFKREMTKLIAGGGKGGEKGLILSGKTGSTSKADQVDAMWKLLTKGEYIGQGPKAPTYTSGALETGEQFGESFPVSDRWHYRALGFLDGKNALGSTSAAEYSAAVTAELARRTGWSPGQVQAALWYWQKWNDPVFGEITKKSTFGKPLPREYLRTDTLPDILQKLGPKWEEGLRADLASLGERIPFSENLTPGPSGRTYNYGYIGNPSWRVLPGEAAPVTGAQVAGGAVRGGIAGGYGAQQEEGSPQDILKGAILGAVRGGVTAGGVPPGVSANLARAARGLGRPRGEEPVEQLQARLSALINASPEEREAMAARWRGRPERAEDLWTETGPGLIPRAAGRAEALDYGALSPGPTEVEGGLSVRQQANRVLNRTAPMPPPVKPATPPRELGRALGQSLRREGVEYPPAREPPTDLESTLAETLRARGIDPDRIKPGRAPGVALGALGGGGAGGQDETDTDEERVAKVLLGIGVGGAALGAGGPTVARVLGPLIAKNGFIRAVRESTDAINLLPDAARGAVRGLDENFHLADAVAASAGKDAHAEALAAGFTKNEAVEYARSTLTATRAALGQEARDSALQELLDDGSVVQALSRNAAPQAKWVAGQEIGDVYAGFQMSPEAAFLFRKIEAAGPTASEYAKAAYKSALLSQPASRIRDTVSTALSLASAPTERALAAPVDVALTAGRRLGQAIRGQPVTAGRTTYLEEAPAMVQGMAAALPTAFRDAMRAVRYGYSANTLRPDVAVAGREVLPGALNLPGRIIGAVDAFSKPVVANGELYAQAVVGAKKQGLKGESYLDEVARLRSNSTPEMRATASQAADYRAFQAPSQMSDWLTRQKQQKGLPGLAWTWALPFHSTAIALTKYLGERNPVFGPLMLGLDVKGGRAGQREIAEGVARVGLGSALVAEGYNLAAQGNLTGGAPETQAERDAWVRQGKEPYSIRIGGTWQSYRGQQFAPILASAYGAWNAVENGNPEDGRAIWLTAAIGAGQALGDDNWFRSLTQLADVLNDPERTLPTFAESQARAVVPGAIQAVARANDAIIRDPQNPIEAALTGIPGLSGLVPARQTAFGQPQTRPAGATGAGALLNPFRSSPERSDPLEVELARLQRVGKTQGFRVEPGLVGGRISVAAELPDVELTREERAQYQEQAGKITYGVLSQMVAAPGWASMPEKEKAKAINTVTSQIRESARATLKPAVTPRAVEAYKRQQAQ